MDKPILSVVIPVYNAAGQIGILAQKILGQKFRYLELIIVDDGSVDNSWGVIQELAKKDKRILICHQKNMGPGEARNQGIRVARGKYIMFCDDDDDFDENIFEKMVETIEKGSDLVVCGMRFIWVQSGKTEDVWTSTALARRMGESIENYAIRLLGEDGRLYSSTNKIFRTDLIRGNSVSFLKRDFGEDTLFVLDYLKYAKNNIEFILKPCYRYHKGTGESTMGKSSVEYKNWQRNYRDVEKWSGGNADKNWLGWLKYRWTVSYLLAVKRADGLSFGKKWQKIRNAKVSKDLPKIGSVKILGLKKWGMEIVIKLFVVIFC